MDNLVEVTSRTPIEIALQIDDEGYTTARKLYAWLELNPAHYARWVKDCITDNPYAEKNEFSPLEVKTSKRGGRPTEDYRITASLAKRISMATKSDCGEEARKYFLGCEQVLKRLSEANHQKELERTKGIAVRQALTKALQQSGENERMHNHAYSSYTNVIYKSIFQKDARQLREEYGIQKKDKLRDFFSEEELKQVQNAEMLISALIGYGWGYAENKEFILNRANKMIE